MLEENSYGKSGIRLVKLIRRGDRHEIRDLTVSVELEGEFTEAHVLGDNARVLPTDTMKNTVYAMARTPGFESIEGFALDLTAHFLRASEAASIARVTILEHPWERLPLGTGGHPHAFARSGGERRVAAVSRGRDGVVSVRAGLENLTILKSSGSGFSGFLRDRYTTLRETDDRILATSVRAEWLYGTADASWTLLARAARAALLETFANHASRSVQHTLHAMGEAVLDRHPEIVEIRLSMPNKHHIPVDLARFGLDNPNDVFVATEEPYGLIEATLRRSAR